MWTPDLFWRLVLYYHGAFIPWMMALAALALIALGLDAMTGRIGTHLKHMVLIGGFFAAPLAALGAIFIVYNTFAYGIPVWTQIVSIGIGGESVFFFILSLLIYPRESSKKLGDLGLPYYIILLSAIGIIIAALMGDVSGWITWFGPWPSIFPQYINSTMYPVLGFYNSTAVVTWTEDVVTSHSHLMLPSVMAAIVALTPSVYGYAKWEKREKALSTIGFVIMVVGLVGSIWIHIVSGVGNYSIPTLFQSGPNGLAMDDMITGILWLGAAFVLVALLAYARKGKTADGTILLKDYLFLSVIAAWIFIYLLIPVTGYYIEFNQSFYSAAGLGFDAAFTRFHQDFTFFMLASPHNHHPNLRCIRHIRQNQKNRRLTVPSRVSITFAFDMIYAMVTLDVVSYTLQHSEGYSWD
jgi:MFS family permease